LREKENNIIKRINYTNALWISMSMTNQKTLVFISMCSVFTLCCCLRVFYANFDVLNTRVFLPADTHVPCRSAHLKKVLYQPTGRVWVTGNYEMDFLLLHPVTTTPSYRPSSGRPAPAQPMPNPGTSAAASVAGPAAARVDARARGCSYTPPCVERG
jgi:hypothetical protein